MLVLALFLTLAADDLSPEKAAQVQKDRDKAMADVAKKFGNKKSSELSPDERREMIQAQRAAENAVLEKNGVEAKDMARYEAKMSLEERAETKAARERLDKKEENDKKAADAKKEAAPQEVQVQRGFSDSNPVVLEEKQNNGAPAVEKGLPPDAQQDQNAASGSNSAAADDSAPAPKKHKGKK